MLGKWSQKYSTALAEPQVNVGRFWPKNSCFLGFAGIYFVTLAPFRKVARNHSWDFFAE